MVSAVTTRKQDAFLGRRDWLGAVALALGLSVAPCWAGGTLETSELRGLLDQQPTVRDALLASVQLSESAFGEIRFGSHFVNLGGARAGPYTIRAVLKGTKREVEVVLCTKFRLLNKKGVEVSEAQMGEAERIDEHLTYVVLREVTSSSMRPECP